MIEFDIQTLPSEGITMKVEGSMQVQQTVALSTLSPGDTYYLSDTDAWLVGGVGSLSGYTLPSGNVLVIKLSNGSVWEAAGTAQVFPNPLKAVPA